MFLIDIAVPRNVEPTVNDARQRLPLRYRRPGSRGEDQPAARVNVAEQAEEIITEEVERMMLRLKTREVTPTIVSLQEQLEQVRMAEIERVRAKLGVLTPQQEEAHRSYDARHHQ